MGFVRADQFLQITTETRVAVTSQRSKTDALPTSKVLSSVNSCDFEEFEANAYDQN